MQASAYDWHLGFRHYHFHQGSFLLALSPLLMWCCRRLLFGCLTICTASPTSQRGLFHCTNHVAKVSPKVCSDFCSVFFLMLLTADCSCLVRPLLLARLSCVSEEAPPPQKKKKKITLRSGSWGVRADLRATSKDVDNAIYACTDAARFVRSSSSCFLLNCALLCSLVDYFVFRCCFLCLWCFVLLL